MIQKSILNLKMKIYELISFFLLNIHPVLRYPYYLSAAPNKLNLIKSLYS